MRRIRPAGTGRPADVTEAVPGHLRARRGLRPAVVALLAPVALIAVGVSAASGAGGRPAPVPLPPPPVPGAYAGSYVLFYQGALAGPIHAVSGCTPDVGVMTLRSSGPPGSPGTVVQPGKVTVEPCRIEVGVGMSSAFGQAIADAINGHPALADFAIARLDSTGRRTDSELDLSGYVSTVTLRAVQPAGSTQDAAWLRLALVSKDGTVTQRNTIRTLSSVPPDNPVNAATGMVTITGPSTRVQEPVGLDPLTVTIANTARTQSGFTPGEVSVPQFHLRIPEDRSAVTSLSDWFSRVVRGYGPIPRLIGTVSVSYQGLYSSSPAFQVTVTGFPIHFDPYPYNGTQRLLGIGVRSIHAAWRVSS